MLLLLVLGVVRLSAAYVDKSPIITLPNGKIRGHELRSGDNNIYYAFQEIPYAAPPVGDLRLQAPVPPKAWHNILDATKNTKVCYQSGTDYKIPNMTESEDCLYLNVYTPTHPKQCSTTRLPVMVWIHGGGDENGAGIFDIYNPKYFMDYGIVVVTMNYRLGALGFLTTEDGVIPGSIGLKDQHLAMQWVKKNIKLFGGDPDKIVIAGESSGAASVGLHLISPKNKGLFRGAILQSGTGITQWTRQDYARLYAFELGRSIDANFKSNNSTELLKLLRSQPATKINNNTVISDIGKETSLIEKVGLIWLPVIEKENLEGTLLTRSFYEDTRTGNINRVPILAGFNSQEHLFYSFFDPSISEERAKYFDKDLSNLIRNKFKMTKENKLIAGRKLKEIYTKGKFEDDVGAVVEFLGDELFTTPVIRHAKLQSRYTDVYLYQLSYKGKMGGLPTQEIGGVTGVGHAEDLGYLWDSRIVNDGSPDDPKDIKTRRRLLTLWSNFVKYLNPTPERKTLLDNVIWEKVTPNNLVYLNINNTLEMQKNPKKYLQWEPIIDKYAIKPLDNY